MVRRCVRAQYSTHVWRMQTWRQVVGRTVAGSTTKHSPVALLRTHGSLPDGTPITLRRRKEERPVENLPLTPPTPNGLTGAASIPPSIRGPPPSPRGGEGLGVGGITPSWGREAHNRGVLPSEPPRVGEGPGVGGTPVWGRGRGWGHPPPPSWGRGRGRGPPPTPNGLTGAESIPPANVQTTVQ